MFDTIQEIVADTAASVQPPERLTVSEAAEKYRRINNPGAYVGKWRNDFAPYLVEPMDLLTSHEYNGIVFAGPAQSGKTDMFLNWQLHTAICDPADMMLIEKSQAAARDFSIFRLDRLFRHSPSVAEKRLEGRQNQNVYDTRFRSGSITKLSWPSINELSGKPIPRLWLTDYDRMDQDVDGEGAPFDLARARATTFQSFGMVVAESSPGFLIEDPKWMAKSPHEAPPTTGILALYNRGDRRRWYWKCVSCKTAFEPSFALIKYPETADDMEAAEAAVMHCPHCGAIYTHSPTTHSPGKDEMNMNGRWIRDRMTWMENGAVMGNPIRSEIASFWIKGTAVAFASWKKLVLNFRKAKQEFEDTNSQEALKTTVNTDQGEPYLMEGLGGDRLPEDMKARNKDLGDRVVPDGVRFLIAAIDIQKNRFVVQVHGFGKDRDVWVIDRFDVKKSERIDPDTKEHFWISPGSHPEDWRLLTQQVMLKSYALSDGSGRTMEIKFTVCDSGGREGVTANAYTYWRFLRDDKGVKGFNLYRRFLLVKGSPFKSAPRVAVSFPDSERKDRRAAARGEVPVLILNTNLVKDQVNKMLDRTEAHGGLVSFPDWLPDWWYQELTAEHRTIKGWENPKNHRNEAWDLLCYAVAGSISQYISIEHINWDKPPSWAAEWAKNDLISTGGSNRFTKAGATKYDLSKLGDQLA